MRLLASCWLRQTGKPESTHRFRIACSFIGAERSSGTNVDVTWLLRDHVISEPRDPPNVSNPQLQLALQQPVPAWILRRLGTAFS